MPDAFRKTQGSCKKCPNDEACVLCSLFCVLVQPNATEAATERSGQEPVSDLDFDKT